MDIRKRKCLAIVERICSFFIILLIAVQLVLAIITVITFMGDSEELKENASDCTGDQE